MEMAVKRTMIADSAAVCGIKATFNVQIGDWRVIEGFTSLRSIIRRLSTTSLVKPLLA
jgi:hypothetical protein